MQNIDKENYKRLRERLPGNYAELLFQRYKKQKRNVSKSLIYKVAAGEKQNDKILSDLLEMAKKREELAEKVGKIEKRIRKIRLPKFLQGIMS